MKLLTLLLKKCGLPAQKFDTGCIILCMSKIVEAGWAQVEAGANAYAGVLESRRVIAAAELAKKAEIARIKDATWPEVLAQSGQSVFRRLGVVEALEAVKDEKWGGEGKIIEAKQRNPYHPGGERFEYSLTLESNPIPRISVTGRADERSLRVAISMVPTKLIIGVLYRRLSVIGSDGVETVYVSDPELNSVSDKMPDVNALIRDRGLEQLSGLLRDCGVGEESRRRKMDYDGSTSRDEFDYHLRDIVNGRVETGTLPGQLRARNEAVIKQFPSQLGERGKIEYSELRRWQHDQRGTNRFIVFCEQRMGFSA